MKRILLPLLAVTLAACAGSNARSSEAESPERPAPALAVATLAGQPLPVLPLTMLIADAPADEFLPPGRDARLTWADSVIGAMLLDHGPEVTWILPPELSRIAARAPNMMPAPDRMGQSVMRSAKLDRIPDPLRSYLRALSAMTNSRLVMIPAALYFKPDSGGIRAELSVLLADTRSGAVVWRSHPSVVGETPLAALRATIAHILPDLD